MSIYVDSLCALFHNISATTAPTVNDDASDGYSVGSYWIDTVANKTYRCVDATTGMAVWIDTSLSAENLGNLAIQDKADVIDDTAYGATWDANDDAATKDALFDKLNTIDMKVTIQTLTDAATIVWDTSIGHKGRVTLGGNRTMGVPTNLSTGRRYLLYCIQDATGSRTLSFNNAIFEFPGGTEPVLSTAANAIDIVVFEYDGSILYGVANYNLS